METARTLRFECGSRGNGEESQSDTGAAEPNLKRPRIAETSIVEVHLVELIRDLEEANEDNDKHYGLFVWPSALLLSQFVAYQAASLCRGKTVLELGCGTGLPSILTALSGASKVYLTDRADADDIKRNAEANIKMNKLEGRAEFISLAWGDMHVSSEIISVLRSVEVILAADCFYQTEDFEKVIASVALIFRCSASTSCKFYFTYQLRSINRSIAPLLSRWGLSAKPIDKHMFLNNVNDVSVQDFDSIYLYEVEALH